MKIFIGIITALIISIWMWMLGDSKKRVDQFPDRTSAYQAAKEYVREELKAPSTAIFPPENQVKIYPIKNTELSIDIYKISGWVESKNSFGVLLKTEYEIELIPLQKTHTYRRHGPVNFRLK